MGINVISCLKGFRLGPLGLWLIWFAVMLAAFMAYIYSWSLAWRWIITPNIKQDNHYIEYVSYKAVGDSRELIGRQPSQAFEGKIEDQDVLVQLYAVLNIDKQRKIKFTLDCDDNGYMSIDRRAVLRLRGFTPHNSGTGEAVLSKGFHLIALNIFNGPNKGWFRLKISHPQSDDSQTLSGNIISNLDSGSLSSVLGAVRWIERASCKVLLFGFGVFFLLIIYRQGDLAFLWPSDKERLRALGYVAAVAALALVCGWFAVDHHVNYLNWASGQDYLSSSQWDRHRSVIDYLVQHRDHRHYRLLPHYVLEAFFLMRHGHVDDPSNYQAFFWLRYAIDVVTFLLAAVFWRRLGLGRGATLLGVSFFTWSIYHTVYNSDLNFSTYLDTTFYLLAGILCLQQRYWALLAVGMLAVLNKETALLIPLLPLAMAIKLKPFKLPQREFWFSLLGLALCVGFYIAIRYLYGWTGVEKAHDRPGLHFLERNLSNPLGIRHLFYAVGPLALLALAGLRRAPDYLVRWFWLIMPIWFAVHTFVAWWEEPRVFMVAMAFCIIPLSLFLATPREKSSPDMPPRMKEALSGHE